MRDLALNLCARYHEWRLSLRPRTRLEMLRAVQEVQLVRRAERRREEWLLLAGKRKERAA